MDLACSDLALSESLERCPAKLERTGHSLPPRLTTYTDIWWPLTHLLSPLLNLGIHSSPALCQTHKKYSPGVWFFFLFTMGLFSPHFYLIFTQKVLCVCTVWLREWQYKYRRISTEIYFGRHPSIFWVISKESQLSCRNSACSIISQVLALEPGLCTEVQSTKLTTRWQPFSASGCRNLIPDTGVFLHPVSVLPQAIPGKRFFY